MQYIATIDISTMIWSQEDFNNNKTEYYTLIYCLPAFLDLIEKNQTLVLLREELKEQILLEFPYSITDIHFRDFQNLSLAFLTNLGSRMVVYPAHDDTKIAASPEICKPHFNRITKYEMRYLITRLYTHRIPDSKFFTYKYFWNETRQLDLNNKDTHSVETIFIDDEKQLFDFFERYKKKFEHNPKHDRYKAKGKVSQLSCYNDRTKDIKKAQTLLDTAIDIDGTLYNFDHENEVFVTFVPTGGIIYHGYDEREPEERVRRRFNK